MNVSSVAAWRGLGLAAGVVLVGALLAGPVAAAKPTKCQILNSVTDERFATLQLAVDAASSGDTLRVKGTCVGSTTIARSVTIVGESNNGFGPATLDGAHAGRVLTIMGGVVSLSGLTITGGTATYGGGLATIGCCFGPTVTVTRSVITSNTATDGGGIGHQSGTVILIDSSVSGNTAQRGGGYFGDDGFLDVRGTTTFSNNHAGLDGGGIVAMTHGGAHLSDSASIDHNTAGRNGGGMIVGDTSVRLNDDASIHDNTAGGDGGGVWTSGSPALLGLNDRSSVSHNAAAGDGGGLFVADMTRVSMAGTSSISGNTAAGNGGGVYNRSNVDLSGASTINNNTATSGGGVYQNAGPSGGTVTLSDAGTISDNHPDNCYPPGSVAGCAS